DRQARLAALQSELIRRERVAVSGRMVAELAHEIRNPVANLRNCLEVIYRRLDHDPQAREFASLAIDELLRMHELAERMLDLNRPQMSDQRACDAGKVARDVAALTRLGNGRVSVSISRRGKTLAALPPDALKQILLNLVQNARDVTPGDLAVTIDLRDLADRVVIDVTDNGPGIAPAIRGRIFDPFFTTRLAAGGVGLGLFVVEGIVRAYGGAVTLEDAANAGAHFRISLPAASDVPDAQLAFAEGGA
ncbi:MAG TPA: HAMP domain-containing sensor histidine kinase, partial [Longimicrobiales bacterium]|nr:HAMP domain-containing sensor histidine kinase [Longimicrobiales bacterium]